MAGPRIITNSLPIAFTGEVYSYRVQAIEETPPLTWSATGLPTGLVINSQTGEISAGVGDIPSSEVGVHTVSVTLTDSVSVDIADVTIEVNPADVQRVNTLILDPRLETLIATWDIGVTREDVTAHFSRRAWSSPAMSPSPMNLRDYQVHTADQITFIDFSDPDNVGSNDYRTLKEVLDDLISGSSLPTITPSGSGVDLIQSSGGNYLSNSLVPGRNVTISARPSPNTHDIEIGFYQSAMPDRNDRIFPTVKVVGQWYFGSPALSPDASPNKVGGVTAHNGKHLYPFYTLSAIDRHGYPHNQHRWLNGSPESPLNNSGFNGYEEGYAIPANSAFGQTFNFKFTGALKNTNASNFVEFVFEPNVQISPTPTYSPSPAADYRMIFNSRQLGITWTGWYPFSFSGEVTFNSYTDVTWTGQFLVRNTVGDVVINNVCGGTDSSGFDYEAGTLLGIRFRLDRWNNLHAWNSTYQGLGSLGVIKTVEIEPV